MATPLKVLVALDDSENATRAVEYISKNFSPSASISILRPNSIRSHLVWKSTFGRLPG